MENNSIREFTCNDCQEVTKVDWSKVRPDIDDGTSNIEIHEKGNGYAYYGECMNCGNLVEIEPPVPELVVDNVDVDKDGMFIQVTDKVTNRSCWIEAWKSADNDDWDWDFNQYIFHLDDDNDVVAKMFQEDLGNYGEELGGLVLDAIYEHEDEYNKLQENKAPTMRDRLKEAKRNKCEHKKTEALEGKNQEVGVCPVCGNTDLDYGDTVMEQVGDYYGYNWKCSKCNHTGTEWYYMSFVDVYNTNTGEESHQEGICPDCGSDLMYDNFVPDGMDGYYEVYCDNCGFTGKEDYNLDFTDHTVNEEINESKEVKTETLHADQKEKLDNGTTRIKLVDDGHEQWFIVKAVKDNGVIDYDYDHDVEQADEDRDYFDSSVDVNDIEEILLKTMKESKKEEAKQDKPVKVLCYGQVTEYPTRQEAIKEFLNGMYSSEGSERERYTNIYLDLVHTDKDFVYDFEDEYEDYKSKHSEIKEEAKSQGDIIKYNGYIAEIDEPNIDNPDETIITIYKSEEDYKNGDYLENVSLKNDNLEQYIKEYIDEIYTLNEAKFKDKVKAIKKSLKKNDKRLSDETAEKSAEKIAGSMVKKEESKTADMDTVDIIMELEGGELTIADVDDWNTVKAIAGDLQTSQGFYGRLLRSMLDAEEEFGGVENLPFPITM